MRTRRVCHALLALLTVPAAAAAQERTERPDAYFMERSRIFNRLPVQDLAFEAQIAPHLFMIRKDPWGDGAVFTEPVTSFAWIITPLVRLRMFSTESFPVRTPSYMPRPFDFQLLRTSLADTATALRESFQAPLRMWGLTLTPWAHHSNGQNGCLFTDQTQDPATGDCLDPGVRAGVPEPNKLDGSFSTNFARLEVGYSRFQPVDTDTRIIARDRCTYQLGVEYHPEGWGPGALSDEQAQYYSRLQATVGAEWGTSLAGQLLIGGEVRWMDDPAPDVSSWIYSATIDWMYEKLHGWGLFARWYSGMDYYNLGFMEEVDYLQVGVVWDIGATPEFLMGDLNPMMDLPAYERSSLMDGKLPWLFDTLCP